MDQRCPTESQPWPHGGVQDPIDPGSRSAFRGSGPHKQREIRAHNQDDTRPEPTAWCRTNPCISPRSAPTDGHRPSGRSDCLLPERGGVGAGGFVKLQRALSGLQQRCARSALGRLHAEAVPVRTGAGERLRQLLGDLRYRPRLPDPSRGLPAYERGSP